MKKTTLILLFFLWNLSFSQTILEEIFLQIEITSIEDLHQNTRKQLIKKYSSNNKSIFKLTNSKLFYETRNELDQAQLSDFKKSEIELIEFYPDQGFLRLDETCLNCEIGAHLELVYWNLKNNSKLVCVKEFTQECCGPSNDSLNFYNYQNGALIKVDAKAIMPEILISDVLKIEQIKKSKLDISEINSFYLKPIEKFYKLPKQGQNIELPIRFFQDYLNQEELKIFKKFKDYYYEKIIFSWNGVSFDVKTH